MSTVFEVFQSSGVPQHTRIDVPEHNTKIMSFLTVTEDPMVHLKNLIWKLTLTGF